MVFEMKYTAELSNKKAEITRAVSLSRRNLDGAVLCDMGHADHPACRHLLDDANLISVVSEENDTVRRFTGMANWFGESEYQEHDLDEMVRLARMEEKAIFGLTWKPKLRRSRRNSFNTLLE